MSSEIVIPSLNLSSANFIQLIKSICDLIQSDDKKIELNISRWNDDATSYENLDDLSSIDFIDPIKKISLRCDSYKNDEPKSITLFLFNFTGTLSISGEKGWVLAAKETVRRLLDSHRAIIPFFILRFIVSIATAIGIGYLMFSILSNNSFLWIYFFGVYTGTLVFDKTKRIFPHIFINDSRTSRIFSIIQWIFSGVATISVAITIFEFFNK